MSKKEQNKPNYLKGKLLIAMPGLGDQRFHHAVLLVCAHDEHGAMALTINRAVINPEPLQLLGQIRKELIQQTGAKEGKLLAPEQLSLTVCAGGPVESVRGFLLHPADYQQEDTVGVNDDFAVTGTIEALKTIFEGKGPAKRRFILGYAGWSPGQLESELQQNAWLVAEPNPDLVFNTPPEEQWEKALATLGIDPVLLTATGGSA